MKLILASNSPRRKELLTEYGFDFEVVKSNFNETVSNLSPKETVCEFALGKALDVFLSLSQPSDVLILGADTVVVFGDKILGKPKDFADAVSTLSILSGKTHSVLTAYAFVSKNERVVNVEKTKVSFNKLSPMLIEDYVKNKKPFDKAGSYGIQDGYPLVEKIIGSYNNVVGLPVEVFCEQLKEFLK